MNETGDVPLLDGPLGQVNWREIEAGAPAAGAWEFAFYSDAHVTGEVDEELGPYRLINAVPHPDQSPPHLSVVFRADYCELREAGIDWSKTDVRQFHGGDLGDELANLLSLALGIRCRSGGLVREFRADRDPRGHPFEINHRRPYLPPTRRNAVLPTMGRTVLLDDAVPLLSIYPRLDADQTVSLLRSARAYANALWIAEDDPESAWLLLVAALEAGSNERWRNTASPDARLEEVLPEFVAHLRGTSGDGVVELVADQFVPTLKATAKFLNFSLEYVPPPPEPRPDNWTQLDWGQMKRHLNKIYEWRSLSLHEGIPFPPPMCEPPRWGGEAGIAETPGAPTATLGGVWDLKDVPMLLNTFVHIAGGVLRSWWSSLG